MILKKEVFDIATFENVKVGLEHTPTPAFTSMNEAIAYWGNDEAKVLAGLSELKDQHEKSAALDQPIENFHTFVDDEDESKGLNGAFTGQLGHEETVNGFVLNLAKQQFGFPTGGKDPEAKRQAKAKAMEYIKNNPAIRAGLVAMSAAMASTVKK